MIEEDLLENHVGCGSDNRHFCGLFTSAFILFYFILSRVKPKLSYKWDLLLCFPPSGSWFFNQCQWINDAAQIGKRPLSKKKKN